MDDTQAPPRMYMEPPTFDIELQDFERLPLLRLEAYALLHSGRAWPAISTVAPQEVTAASLLLYSHANGDSPGAIRHRHADVSSHFVLRLACCGRGSTISINDTDGSSSHGSGDGTHVGRRQDPGGGDADDRENEYERVRDRREWFVRAEKDVFETRLEWYLHGRSSDDDCRGNTSAGSDEEAKTGNDDEEVGAGLHEQGLLAQRHPIESHRRQATSLQEKTVDSRLEALRLVYGLGWLQPMNTIQDPERLETTTERDMGRVKRRKETDSGQTDHPSESASGSIWSSCGESDVVFTSASALDLDPGTGCGHNGFQHYTCPFEKVLHLVRRRQVVLRGGTAIVSPEQVPSVLVEHFKNLLRNSLRVTARGLPMVEEDERVRQMLRQVRKAVDSSLLPSNADINSNTSDRHRSAVTINRDNLDAVANKHFPLCMRRIVRVLRREHHLKYQARLQLISFLLNAGMEVGELLAIWRDEFPKGMPKEEYTRKSKGYEYSLRHLYGLEGKRRAYTPMSCSRIAASGYGSGEGGLAHGCPFTAAQSRCPQPQRFNSEHDDTVRGMLAQQLHLPPVDIEDIIRPPSVAGSADVNSSALIACRRHFDVAHSSMCAGGGEGEARTLLRGVGQEASPNGWLAASTRAHALRKSESRGAVVANPARVPWMRQENG